MDPSPAPKQLDLDRLLDKRLLFVTGKGGVGKSVVTAALGLVAARRGKRVLICDLDTRPTYSTLFDVPRVGDEPVRVADGLWASQVDHETWLIDIIATKLLPSPRLVRPVANNRIFRTFLRTAPSMSEIGALHRLHLLSSGLRLEEGEPGWDLVLVDMPATGHAVTFLKVPQILAKMFRVGRAAKLTRTIDDWIRDARVTGVLLVALPEELPVNETIELWNKLQAGLGLTPEGVVINGVHVAPVTDDKRELLRSLSGQIPRKKKALQDPSTRLLVSGRIGLGWNTQDHHYVQQLHQRLPGPFAQLPFSFERDSDRQLVRQLADHLAR